MEGWRALREAICRYAWVVLDMGLTNGSGRCPAGRDRTSFTLHSMLTQTIHVHQVMHLYEVQRPYTWAIWRRLPALQKISSIPALHESEA